MKKNGNAGILILLGIFIVTGVVIVVNTKRTVSTPPGQAASPNKSPLFPAPTPAPTETEEHNPDGTMKLIMHWDKNDGNTTIYTFFTSDIDGGNKKLIFTKTEPKDVTMTIHHNSFSPDNKLVIIEEHSGSNIDYFVLKVNGEPFASGSQFLNINALYTDKNIKYTFRDVTGWAGNTLAIVRTNNEDGSKGPSFWFVTDSKAFLQLIR